MPPRRDCGNRALMRGLGYQRYGAHGGDFGSAVTTFMALDDPAPMLGIHLSTLDLAPYNRAGVTAAIRN